MAIWKDKYLVLLTQWGCVKMDLDTEKITQTFDGGKQYGNHCFLIDSQDYIWITTGRVINKINLNNQEDRTVFRCGENGLGNQPVSAIYEDKKDVSSSERSEPDSICMMRRTILSVDILPKTV